MRMKNQNSRRTFLKRAGLLAASATVAPHLSAVPLATQSLGKTPKVKHPLTVLFIGDSITDGNRTRNDDWNHLLGHGYAQMLAARLWFDHPDRFAMFHNRGISGNTVADLAGRWQTDVIGLKPDVVSILAGINDVYGIVKGTLAQTASEFENTYRAILQSTQTHLPNAKIVVCEPFILPGGRVDEKTEVWEPETAIRQQIARKLAVEFNAVFVPLQQMFTNALKKAPPNTGFGTAYTPCPPATSLLPGNC